MVQEKETVQMYNNMKITVRMHKNGLYTKLKMVTTISFLSVMDFIQIQLELVQKIKRMYKYTVKMKVKHKNFNLKQLNLIQEHKL